MFNEFLVVFIPMFFTVDPIGILPVYASLTDGLSVEEKDKIILHSLCTASALALGFIFLGKFIFNVLGITMGDFMVAGGFILFALAIIDLTTHSRTRRNSGHHEVGAVPIGTPLIVGPAVLTIALMNVNVHGLGLTLLAVFSNLLIVACVFKCSHFILRVLGRAGSRALSKVMMLLLASIGIMMIRHGIMEIMAKI